MPFSRRFPKSHRYSYVDNNPIRNIDPSGHTSEADCEGLPTPGPREACEASVNDPEISYIDPPAGLVQDNSSKSVANLKGYEGLMALLNNKAGWWWDDGAFTLEDALAILLYGETGDVPPNIHGEVPTAIIDATAQKWQKYCSGGWDTSECFLSFWNYYQALYPPIRDNTLRTDLQTYEGGIFIQAAEDVMRHKAIDVNSSNVPQGWVTIYKTQKEAFNYAQGHQFAYQYLFTNLSNGEETYFLVLTVNEQDDFCAAMGMPNMCNLTQAP